MQKSQDEKNPISLDSSSKLSDLLEFLLGCKAFKYFSIFTKGLLNFFKTWDRSERFIAGSFLVKNWTCNKFWDFYPIECCRNSSGLVELNVSMRDECKMSNHFLDFRTEFDAELFHYFCLQKKSSFYSHTAIYWSPNTFRILRWQIYIEKFCRITNKWNRDNIYLDFV